MNVISQQKAFLFWYQNQILSNSLPNKPDNYLSQQAYNDFLLKYNQYNSFFGPQQLFYQPPNFNPFPTSYLPSKPFVDFRGLSKEEFVFPNVIKEEENCVVKHEFESPSTDSNIQGQEHTGNDSAGQFADDDTNMKGSSSLLNKSKKIIKKQRPEDQNQNASSKDGEKTRKIRNLWTKKEDEQLLKLIEVYGRKWTKIGEIIGGRSCKQVRDRYLNNLRSGITSQNWTSEEDEVLKLMYYIVGSRWSKIAVYLPGRCESQVKNRFYKQIKGDLRPRTDKPYLLAIIKHWKAAYHQGAQVKVEHMMGVSQDQNAARICQILDDMFRLNRSSEKAIKTLESLFEMKTPIQWLESVILKLEGETKPGNMNGEDEETQLSVKQEFSEQRSS